MRRVLSAGYGGRCTLVIPPGWVGCTNSLLSESTLPAPGSIPTSRVQLRLGVTVTAGPGCAANVREAQFGRNPWVGASQVLQDHKGVMVGVLPCAELLRSPCEKDRTIG